MSTKTLFVAAAASFLFGCTADVPGEPSDRGSEGIDNREDVAGDPLPLAAPPISDAIIAGAPGWPLHAWTRMPLGAVAPTPETLLGRVAVVLCFQHW
jgi:hypothetical protein